MIFASTSVILDPIWPWSWPRLGVPLLVLAATLITVFTVLTYWISWRGSWKKFAAMLSIRLLALLVAVIIMARPSLSSVDKTVLPSKLLFLFDASGSMSINDEFNNQSRWNRAKGLLQSESIKEEMERLQKTHRMEMIYYQGAEKVQAFKPDAKADGKRTNMGFWFNELFKRHGSEPNLRGLVLVGDGADNDTRMSALEEAKRFRSINCPVVIFGVGSPTTTPKQRDIYFLPNQIFPSPSPVPNKTELTVKGVVNAPGFEGTRVTARLFIEGKENKAARQEIILVKSDENEITLKCDAPAKPGEYRVTMKIDPVLSEVSKLNNEISTYVTVTKEGLSILWVEGKKRAFESVFIVRHALSREKRFRVYYTERLKGGDRPVGEEEDWFNFKKKQYDVIVIGDISASRFCGGKPEIFDRIEEMVAKRGTGLLMLGGYETFGNSDWQNYSPIRKMLPVQLDERGQEPAERVLVIPTEAGFDHYLMRLVDDAEENRRAWRTIFRPLDGMTKLGTIKPGATVLAKGDNGEPILAFNQFGEGRVLVFGGDTTWKAWRRNYEAIDAYKRFWKRTMLWLARQENVEGSVYAKLETRRLPAASNQRMGITVGLIGKSGVRLPGGKFTVKVISPDKKETLINTFPEEGKEKGYFWETNLPGEYVVEVKGEGKDEDGSKITGETKARFLAYAEDLENLRPAADHEYLSKLARSGGGKFYLAGENELKKFLQELHEQTQEDLRPKTQVWPDWNRNPASSSFRDQASTLWSSGVLVCYLLFAGLLCLEWVLRRRWGMV